MLNIKKDALALGKKGEILTREYLIHEGFTILGSNIRIRGGEIDLIAQKKDLVVCVEVKTRTESATDMAELISPWQQKRIVTTARHFLAHHKLSEVTCRFDVALINLNTQHPITYIADAFQEESPWNS